MAEILTREFVVEKVGSGEGRDGRPFNYIRDGLSDDDDVYWAKHHKQIEHLEPGNRVRVQCTASKKHHNYNLIGNAENLDAKDFCRHQRDNHVIATKTDPKNRSRHEKKQPVTSKEEQRNPRGDKYVCKQHHILFGKAIGQPAHEQPTGDTESEH